MENAPVKSLINSKEQLSDILKKLLCTNSQIEMDVKEFFDCIRTSNSSSKKNLTFTNCDFYLSNEGGKQIGMALDYGINFKECYFYTSINWISIGLKSGYEENGIKFNNCTFKEEIRIEGLYQQVDSSKIIQLSFSNCTINKSCTINSLQSNNNISGKGIHILFSHNTIKNDLIISKCDHLIATFKNNRCNQILIECCFIEEVELEDNSEFHATQCTINQETNFKNGFQFFSETIFNKEFNYQGNNIDTLHAKECVFKDLVRLDDSCIKEICFDDSTFEKKLYCSNAAIDRMFLCNCKFYDTVKFYNILNHIRFANFSTSTIKGLFLFDGWDGKKILLEADAVVDFSNIFVESGGYLIIKHINEPENNHGDFKFTSANILGNVVFANVTARSLDLKFSSIIGAFNAQDINISNFTNRHTLLSLKNEAMKRSDSISALKYRAAEMKMYRKELMEETKNAIKSIHRLYSVIELSIISAFLVLEFVFLTNEMYHFFLLTGILAFFFIFARIKKSRIDALDKTWLKVFKQIPITDILLLRFNTLSNKNGTSWMRGLLFTTGAAASFYTLYAYSTREIVWSTDASSWIIFNTIYWKEVLGYLWLVDLDGYKNIFDDAKDISLKSAFIFLFGKIFIAYGIYQTISAFRKYGKS